MGRSKAQGSILLSDIKVVSQHDIWTNGKKLDPRGLKIVTADRDFLWRAESKDDAEHWAQAIKAMISNYSGTDQPQDGAVGTWEDEDHDDYYEDVGGHDVHL